jgi:hypothetical protein
MPVVLPLAVACEINGVAGRNSETRLSSVHCRCTKVDVINVFVLSMIAYVCDVPARRAVDTV